MGADNDVHDLRQHVHIHTGVKGKHSIFDG